MKFENVLLHPSLLIGAGVAVFIVSMFLSQEDNQVPHSTGTGSFAPGITPPANNLPSPEKILLGRHLFYDTALSFNNTLACSSCHHQDKAFSDGLQVSPGATGELTRRNAMTLTNVGFNAAFTWADSTVVSLEQQALIPMTGVHPIEMGISGHETEVLERIGAIDRYRQLFASAFPVSEPSITLENVTKALAAFERTLLSYESPYDRYLAGEKSAISTDAQRGRALFFSEELRCFRCHGGHNFRFTLGHRRNEADRTVAFHNTGLYNVNAKGDYPVVDQGLIEVSGQPSDMGKFKTPTLRNVTLTAPYMHDGSIATLEDVLQHYARGGRSIEQGENAGDGSLSPWKSDLVDGFELSANDVAALLAFLDSLTDRHFVSAAHLSAPAK